MIGPHIGAIFHCPNIGVSFSAHRKWAAIFVLFWTHFMVIFEEVKKIFEIAHLFGGVGPSNFSGTSFFAEILMEGN